MGNATIQHQFYVDTPNKIGEAYKLSNWIYDSFGTNLRTFFGTSFDNNGRFYFITDNDEVVKSGFKNSDYTNWGEQDVVVYTCKDVPGECAKYTKILADAGINIHFVYTTIFDNKPAIVFSTDDNQKAFKLFS